jgi:hypothetical protein
VEHYPPVLFEHGRGDFALYRPNVSIGHEDSFSK